jgi:cytochrome c556
MTPFTAYRSGESVMFKGFGVFVACSGFVLGALTLSPTNAQDKKDPSIKDIMTRAHKGGNSLLAAIGKEVKSKSPDWTAAEAHAKELVALGVSLGKNEPSKGAKESWQKLTSDYLDHAKKLEQAISSKDQKVAQAEHGKLGSSCAACHKLHK